MFFLKNLYLKSRLILIVLLGLLGCHVISANAVQANLPSGFVYLKDIDPSIIQDMRYAGFHNFIGHPMPGYESAECVLTRPAALALARVQGALKSFSLSLKVYDCYRPQMAVNEFIAWSQQPDLLQMKGEFYPRVNKADFFKLGYVATKSGHSRGSTVDLTVVPLATKSQEQYEVGQKLVSCFAPYQQRFNDGSIDMGTGFDCLDPTASYASHAGGVKSVKNRLFLRSFMQKYGFTPYALEWWHFTLAAEPFKDNYFNFPIRPSYRNGLSSLSLSS